MIPWTIGVALLVAIFVLIYFLQSRNDNIPKSPEKLDESLDPKTSDVILARLTTPDEQSPDYAILWNGTPNKSYEYSITETTSGALMASGIVKCPASGVVKIKGLSLMEDSIYNVKINKTNLQIRFAPPEFYFPALSLPNGDENSSSLDFNTSSTPTDLEVIYGGQKVARGFLNIKFSPPGFTCEGLNGKESGTDVTIMIYNGPNAVNILTMPLGGNLSGETQLL